MAEEEYDYTKVPMTGSVEGIAKDAPKDSPRIGVYVCHCGINIKMAIDVPDVVKYAATLPNVALAQHYIFTCSDPGQNLIKEDLKAGKINRVIVAACSPRMHEPTFRGTCASEGLNPFFFEMANIREHCSWPHGDYPKEATQKAKDLLRSAVARSALLELIEEKKVDVIPETVVIGAGVSGLYAALAIADAGYKVHLVEKNPSIGGHAAQLDRTYPVLDKVASILTPRMIDVGAHPNINLMTYSEVENIEGYVGNYKTTVKRKPRFVNEKCTGCGACELACPVKDVPSEFDEGMSQRTAIYLPFPNAVPPLYTVDPENCSLFKEGKCGDATLESVKEGKAVPACMTACEYDAIDFGMTEVKEDLEVGTIIVATGFDIIDPSTSPEYKYGVYPNVITGLQFERLSAASGPTGGKIELNGKEPKDVVFISCVGSRNKQTGHEYCSRVCCMYIAKQAHMVKEKLPDANVTICYQDVRAFGKGDEEFYGNIKAEGVSYRRGLPAEIYQKPGSDRVVVRAEDTLLGEPYELEADLVVLGVGMQPNEGVWDIVNMLKLSQSPDSFLLEAHPKLRPVDTATDGVFIAGCASSPKDIPDTIAQGKAAAAGSLVYLVQGRAGIEPAISQINEEVCIGCGTCAELCPYGALELDAVRQVMIVNEAMCKGCGGCNAVCPSGAATMKHFRDRQVYSQIEALLQRKVPVEIVDLSEVEAAPPEEPVAPAETAEPVVAAEAAEAETAKVEQAAE